MILLFWLLYKPVSVRLRGAGSDAKWERIAEGEAERRAGAAKGPAEAVWDEILRRTETHENMTKDDVMRVFPLARDAFMPLAAKKPAAGV